MKCRDQLALFLCTACCLLTAGCSCDKPTGPTGAPSAREKCTPNLAYCSNNIAKLCGQDGYVEERTRCTDHQVCLDGACDNNVVCTANERICVMNQLKICNAQGTALELGQDCGNEICTNGSCVDPSGLCPSNAQYCENNVAIQCNATGDGYVGTPQDCGQDICLNGVCQPLICTAGAASCELNVAQTCNALGTGYSSQEICEGLDSCISGRCQTSVCSPGNSCSDNILITCNDQGTQIIAQRDCAPQTCSGGSCGEGDAGGADRTQVDGQRSDLHSPDNWLPDIWSQDGFIQDGFIQDGLIQDRRIRYDSSVRPDAGLADTRQDDIATRDILLPDSATPDARRPDSRPAPDAATTDIATVCHGDNDCASHHCVNNVCVARSQCTPAVMSTQNNACASGECGELLECTSLFSSPLGNLLYCLEPCRSQTNGIETCCTPGNYCGVFENVLGGGIEACCDPNIDYGLGGLLPIRCAAKAGTYLCDTDEDCPSDWGLAGCNKQQTPGVCVSCNLDSHCSYGVCIDNNCRDCRIDADCQGGFGGYNACIQNECVQCRGDEHCEDGVCIDNRCRDCHNDQDCTPPDYACVDSICRDCRSDQHCPTEAPACLDHTCRECREDNHCPVTKPACLVEQNTCTACIDDTHCSNPDLPACYQGQTGNQCVECMQDDHCDDPANPSCAGTFFGFLPGHCAQCVRDSDCQAATPICAGDNTCVECTEHSDCLAELLCEQNQCQVPQVRSVCSICDHQLQCPENTLCRRFEPYLTDPTEYRCRHDCVASTTSCDTGPNPTYSGICYITQEDFEGNPTEAYCGCLADNL